jgi:hypothetical protein
LNSILAYVHKYGKKAQQKVKRAMHERKRETLKKWAIRQKGDDPREKSSCRSRRAILLFSRNGRRNALIHPGSEKLNGIAVSLHIDDSRGWSSRHRRTSAEVGL